MYTCIVSAWKRCQVEECKYTNKQKPHFSNCFHLHCSNERFTHVKVIFPMGVLTFPSIPSKICRTSVNLVVSVCSVLCLCVCCLEGVTGLSLPSMLVPGPLWPVLPLSP